MRTQVLMKCCAVAVVALVQTIASAGPSPSAYTEEAIARGLSFTMDGYPQSQGYLGQGSAFIDLDSDGDPDIVLIGRNDGLVGIFENIGSGVFVDHTLTSGIPALTQQEAIAAADYNADGYLDLYLTQANNDPNYLMENNGNFTFTDVTGVTITSNGSRNSTGAAWADYNDDGWPDLYVSNYGQFNALFRNNFGVNFSSLGVALGVSGGAALSFQNVWSDYDRDGDLDLYLSNDRGHLGNPQNILWRNDNGTFVDVSVASGTDVAIYSMGIGAGDMDNNSYPDYYVTNINGVDEGGEGTGYDGINPLLMNQTDGTFLEQSELWGVDNRITSWGAIFFDYDNDGFKDIYVNNQLQPNSFFHCTGSPVCSEMAATLGIEAAYDPVFDVAMGDFPEIASFSSAVADVDGDGDLDLLVNNPGHRAELFINHEGSNRNHIRYNVVGEYPNNHAIGVNIETFAGGRVFWDENYAGGNGYLGQNELILHVGLDDIALVDQAIVNWPSAGPTRTLTNLPVNETWTIYPPSRLCDYDGDAFVDDDDYAEFETCFFAGFTPGCEMMDFTGNSSIYVDDLAACFVNTDDCNLNGTLDQAEILFDPSLDLTGDGAIDCCSLAEQPIPNPVGDTLLLDRAVSNPVLSRTAPASDAANHPASSYDVLRSNTTPDGDFLRLTNVTGTTHTDTSSADVEFYLIVARNECGSSGEEPF